MPVILMGKDANRAGKPYSADAVEYEQMSIAGGLSLHVAVVASAIGGEERGETAAKLAVKAVLDSLRAAADADVPALLRHAFADANRQVYTYRDAQPDANAPTGNKGVSLAAAIIVDGKTLYVANLGTCRIYLYQHKELRLSQLTLDHTFANVMVQQGRMSLKAAQSAPQANQIVKSVGVPVDVVIDAGFYLGTTEYERAAELGRQGYTLGAGDAVILCSENLSQRSNAAKAPLITDQDIMTALTTLAPGDAARMLIDTAMAHQPEDGVAMAILQPEHRYRAARRQGSPRVGLIATLLFVGLVAALIVAGLNAARVNEPPAATETDEENRVAFVETAMRNTVEAFTPTPSDTPTETPTLTPTPTITPTFTPRPTLEEAEVGALFLNVAEGAERQVLRANAEVETGESFVVVAVNHNPDAVANDANIYAQPNTHFRFANVSDEELRLALVSGDIFIDTGDYPVAFVELERAPGLVFSVQGSSMSLAFSSEDLIAVNCFEGSCNYTGGAAAEAGPVVIPAGEQRVFDLVAGVETSGSAIPSDDAVHYLDILTTTLGGQQDAQAYIDPYLPTATPTPLPPTRSAPRPTATFLAPAAPTGCGPYGC